MQSAVDALVDFGNELLDADTWTEELQTDSAGCVHTVDPGLRGDVRHVCNRRLSLQSPRPR